MTTSSESPTANARRLGRWGWVAGEVALGVGLAVVVGFWAVRIARSWGGAYWVVDAVAGALVGGFALGRRVDRGWAAAGGLVVAGAAVVAAGVGGLPSEPGPAVALGLSVLVGSAIRVLPSRAACLVAAGGLAVAAASVPGAHNGAVVALNAGGWLAAVTVGGGLRLLAARREAAAERVRRDERLRLARELHDVAAHHMTGIILQAQAARLLSRKRPAQVEESLADIEDASTGALSALRRVVGLLRDPADEDPAARNRPPGPATAGLADLIARFNGPPVTFRTTGDGEGWPPEVAGTVYRVVQESLTNVARHASRARTVTVDVMGNDEEVVVEVTDDTPPSTSRHRTGYGLLGMRERVQALDGTLRAGPREEGGWHVRATLPLGPRP